MELIPILSLIILVATISTFILAVGAYILYKIRERKGRVGKAPQPATIPAEMITPVGEHVGTREGRRTYTEERYTAGEYYPEQERQPIFSTSAGMNQTGPEMRPTYVQSSQYTDSRSTRPPTGSFVTGEGDRAGKRKFLRYTSEGYVAPQNDEKNEKEAAQNLRWR